MELNEQTISVKKLVLKKLYTPTMSVLLFMGLFTLFTFKFWMANTDSFFQSDVNQYYSYLIAEFIHHDFSFHFQHNFWLMEAPNGDVVPKVTMGMAILYFPFFIIGNNIAFIFDYDPLGYSSPFVWCIRFGTFIYVFIGFWYLRKTLLLFFSEWVSAGTMFLILFSTNLFYYTYREGEMTHSYLFFFFSLFLYHSIKWHSTSKLKHFYYVSFIAGFITLIRPTEMLVLIIPLLYGIASLQDLKFRFKEIFSLKWKLLLAALLFLAPIIPQLIFWKEHTGRFLFFSYGSNEGFFFGDPKLYSVLFGWHKGWFIYTPIALFMIAGLVQVLYARKKYGLPIAAYLVINIYLISCWWDWGFGGAFGMRALVQCFAFLALPLAYFISYLFSIKRKVIKALTVAVCFLCFDFFISLNLFQMWEVRNVIFHWDSMTKESYKFIFFRVNYSGSDRAYLETLLRQPDYESMRRGDRDEK